MRPVVGGLSTPAFCGPAAAALPLSPYAKSGEKKYIKALLARRIRIGLQQHPPLSSIPLSAIEAMTDAAENIALLSAEASFPAGVRRRCWICR